MRKFKNRKTCLMESLESRCYLSAINFATHTDFSAGTSPVALATADFNADRNADLAVADSGSDSVQVYLGNGAGTFTAGALLALSAPPVALLAADFNGDGLPDIAVLSGPTGANSPVTVEVFLNTGNDTFSSALTTTVVASVPANDPVAFADGDFNGDKKLDLAVTDYDNETVSVLIGNNTGLFGVPVAYTGDSHPSAIAAGEFTGYSEDDLAITTVALDPTTQLPTKSVSLLDNDGTGNFSLGQNLALGSSGDVSAIAVADLTGAGAPDLVVGNTDSTASVLLNTGGAFELSSAPPLPAASTAVTVSDFDLDGAPDLVSANGGTSATTSANSISVIPGLGDGTYAAAENFPTGAQPVAVVVADFNNDGRPDIATANEAAGTISILLNTTVVVTVTTKTTLTTSDASVPAGTSINLTATIVPSSTSPLTGEGTPTGTVDYYDGSTFIGSTTVTAGTDQAVFPDADLSVGSHKLTAVYRGDLGYSVSTSAAITQAITPTANQGPDLVGTFVSSTFPTTAVPGETGAVKIRVTNQGNSLASGPIVNALYLSLDTTLDSSDLPVAIKGNLAKTNVHLNPNQSVVLTGTYTVPADVPLATYYPLVWLNSTSVLAESNSANDVAAAPTAYTVLDAFGTVAGRPNITLQVPDSDGTLGTFRLTGPGSGTVNFSDSGVSVLLDGTAANSALTITTAGGNTFDIDDLTAGSAIGTVKAPTVAISDAITLPGGATSLAIASIGGNSSITLGSGAASSLSLGTVVGTTLTAASGIRSLAVNSWSGTSIDSISAPWIGTILSKAAFGPSLSISGTGAPGGVAVGSATITGSIGSGAWSVDGSIARLRTGSVPAGWSGSVDGTVRSFTDTGNFAGVFAATAFSAITVSGDLDHADILAGANFGPGGRLSSRDDTFASGAIGSLTIQGSVSDSVIAAGLIPTSSELLGSGSTLAGSGSIHVLSVIGSVDSASRILAQSLPAKARLGGAIIDPTTDPNCQLG